MTEEYRDRMDEQEQAGHSEAQTQGGVADLLKKGADVAGQFMEDLKVPAGTTETVVGTILGCLTVRAFTKAWPLLETPVRAAGYAVGGYAVYRLAKAAFDQGTTSETTERDDSAECVRV